MSRFDEHPTVRAIRERAAPAAQPPPVLDAQELRELVLASGADDCGFVDIADPALEGERPHVAAAFPAARTLVSIVKRMHREPIRSPKRSVANLEFHRTGDDVDEIARRLVGALEARGIAALNPAMAFPMEMSAFPERGWIVSHKIVAQAAGLGKMGVHRSLIHPRFGSFVLLGTVFVAAPVDRPSAPLEYNPCLNCNLCVAACPVGAIKADGAFDFSACFTHNYQQFMGGFVNWVEDVAASRSAGDYDDRVGYSESVERWQSLSYGPNYNAAYCIAVCPAGEDVIGRYLADKPAFVDDVVRPLQAKPEPVYVVRESDAADHLARRFPHKRARFVRASARSTTVETFLFGMTLGFQAGKAKDLSAVYHFTFRGESDATATVTIREGKLTVARGLHGRAGLRIGADAATWIRFVNGRASLVWALLTRAIRLSGDPRLLLAFGRCFPR